MINVMNEVENRLDSELWHACAGGMVQMPPLKSKVFYFPQGHAEHAASTHVNFGDFPKISPYFLCQVNHIKFMADTDTDEVYAKIGLVPINNHNDSDVDDDGFLGFDPNKNENQEKPSPFAKTLTQSDANNGGGFSVPRSCAETIFPRLDYKADPPVQVIFAKDVHGRIWKFRHIYRGTPRRHLLTTGWSSFVNHKKLVAGDSIVFLRDDNGDLCIGIRRAKRGISGGVLDSIATSLYGNLNCSIAKGKVSVESVIEAANLAACGQPFEVVYYPRACTPEFCIKASTVKMAMRVQWRRGMRFKMAFETDDSSRISWFMGTISSVHVQDHIRWPNSPWRLLEVEWDEPDLLQNVKRVNPWLVELVSNVPSIHLSPFSPPRKRLRIPQPPEFHFLGQLSLSPFVENNIVSTSIQGARQNSQFGINQIPHFEKIQSFPFGYPNLDPSKQFVEKTHKNDEEKDKKKPALFLFGQPIWTKQQLSESCSGDMVPNLSDDSVVLQNGSIASPSGEQNSEPGLETDHCKVFMESENVGRTLDLSVLRSYEELYVKLAEMFGVQKSDVSSNLIYHNAGGAGKHAGDEPFSEFSKMARRLTILMDRDSDN